MPKKNLRKLSHEELCKKCETAKECCLLWMSICAKCGSVYHKSHKEQFTGGLSKTKIICNCGNTWYICHGHSTHKELEKIHSDLRLGKEIVNKSRR